jgi:hypothetical protein
MKGWKPGPTAATLSHPAAEGVYQLPDAAAKRSPGISLPSSQQDAACQAWMG